MIKQRKIEWTPAFDKRSDDPKKNYGIHGVELRFLLSDENKTVQFVLFTGWQLPHVAKEEESQPHDKYCRNKPMPADLGYHSPFPLYEDHFRMENCEYTGSHCYYDGSGLNAIEAFDVLVSKGDEALWEFLEEYFDQVFNDEDAKIAEAAWKYATGRV